MAGCEAEDTRRGDTELTKRRGVCVEALDGGTPSEAASFTWGKTLPGHSGTEARKTILGPIFCRLLGVVPGNSPV